MHKGYLRTAFILAAVTVALGAFGAHRLKEMVSDDAVEVYQTAVFYQFIHVIALATAGIVYKEYPNKWIKASGILFLLGILFFSGSLYILTYSKATVSPGFKWVGPITPVGGVCFIAGWICAALGIRRKP
jgi:uncharacterized membrane protein YgdD (TMEM256/DUF423 family)